jgi:hypothetical protein
MRKYNQGLRNSNKNVQMDLDSISMLKLLERGKGLKGMVHPSLPPKELVCKAYHAFNGAFNQNM